MDKVTAIRKALRAIAGDQLNLPFTATVVSLQEETCSVRLESGLELTDVKLKATIKEDGDYVVFKPTVNSKVLIFSLSGDLDNLTVIKVDEIDSIELKKGTLEISLDGTDNKLKIKNGDISLVDVLTDLAKDLKQLRVFTPVGASGTPLPPTIVKLETFETKIKQLLK